MDREIGIEVRRRRVLRRAVIGLITVGCAAGVLVVGADWLRPSMKKSRIRLGVVERGDIEATLHASGTVIPAHERVVSCPIDARIEQVLLRPGQAVEQGTGILELDTSATRLQLDKLEEQLAQNHNERLQRRIELEQELSALESQIDARRLDLEIARFRLEQKTRLYEAKLIAEEEFKEAGISVKKSEIELRRLEEEMGAKRRLNGAKLERLELDASILRRDRDETRRQLALAAGTSPVEGVLTWVYEDEGATVPRGEVLARVADLKSFRVEAKVSDAYAPRLSEGQDAHVLIGDVQLPARVSQILPTIEEGTIGFIVDLEQVSHPLLRHNLRVDVLVVTGRRSDVLKAPRGPYIRGGGDRHQIFVVDDDRARRTDVTLGLVGHKYFEVVDGLQEGDEIVLSDVRDYLHAKTLRLK